MATNVPRRAGGRRAGRRDDVRDELLKAMERLLVNGERYSQISIERLASEAGMSRTRFYMYYEDKADLLHSAYMRLAEEWRSIVAEWWDSDEPIERSRLRRILGELVRVRAKHALVSAAVRDAASTDPLARKANEALKASMIDYLQAAIERWQQLGHVDSHLDAASTAGWLGWMLERGIDRLVADPRPIHLRRVADSVTTLVWNTLYAPTAHERAP